MAAAARHTKLTATQRDRKRAAALRKLAEAQALLAEIADDFTEHGYLLNMDEQAERRAIVNILVPVENLLAAQ